MQHQPPAATTSLTRAFRRRCLDVPSTSTTTRSRANPDRPGAVFLYHGLRPGDGVISLGSGPGRCPGAGLRHLPARQSILPTQEPTRQLAGCLDEDLKVEGDRVLADVKQVECNPLLDRQLAHPQPPDSRAATGYGSSCRLSPTTLNGRPSTPRTGRRSSIGTPRIQALARQYAHTGASRTSRTAAQTRSMTPLATPFRPESRV